MLNTIGRPTAHEPDVGRLIRARLAGGWEDVAPTADNEHRHQADLARNVHQRLALRGLRDEPQNLADAVDRLLERLDSAFDAQKRFVANAAHELPTPLTLEHTLLEESLLHRDSDTSSMRSIMRQLLDLSEQQVRLLESLLMLAKSEGGLEDRGHLDLAAIAERMVRTAEGTGPGGGEGGDGPEPTTTAPEPVRQSVPRLTGEPPGPAARTADW